MKPLTRLSFSFVDGSILALEFVFPSKSILAAVFATEFRAREFDFWIPAMLAGVMSREVGPAFRGEGTAV